MFEEVLMMRTPEYGRGEYSFTLLHQQLPMPFPRWSASLGEGDGSIVHNTVKVTCKPVEPTRTRLIRMLCY